MTLDEALQLVDGKYAVNDAGKSPPNSVPSLLIGVVISYSGLARRTLYPLGMRCSACRRSRSHRS